MERRRDSKGRVLLNGERQKPDGRYEYRYTDINGKRKSIYSWRLVATDKLPPGKKQLPSLREAEKQILKDKDDGIYCGNTTLNSLFGEFLRSKFWMKQSTLAQYQSQYKKRIWGGLGRRNVDKIKYSDVKKLYTELIEGGLNVNSLTILNALLIQLFDIAVKDNIIRNNPATGVFGEVKKLFKYSKTKRHPLSREEQYYFLKYCTEHEEYSKYTPLFVFILSTGCRIGEANGITWDDIDFDNNIIHIVRNVQYISIDGKCQFVVGTPKTSSGNRDIPMTEELREELLKERERQIREGCNKRICDLEGVVFNYKTTLIDKNILHIIKGANEEYGCDIRRFSVHNLRHTFCSRLCENETNIKIIQEVMGHSTIQTTMDIYNESSEEHKKSTFLSLPQVLPQMTEKICEKT